MAVSTFVVLLMCTWMVHARYGHLQWSNCGSDPRVSMEVIDVTPMPVVMPGDIHLTVQGRFNFNFTGAELHLSIKRHTFLFDLPVPCLNNVGSCTYEISCSGPSLLETMVNENWGGIFKDLGQQLLTMMSTMTDLKSSQCPVPPGSVDLQAYTLHLPAVPTNSILFFLNQGDKSINVRVTEKSTGRTLLCLDFPHT
ncbi:uncharacterized protein LOC143294042 [Babylonia areolata]|uniref:uncharacterized protein LOC143294042 n=1 Tax=Babylonia areolata TaxID=304850 RepID=UPI003FD0F62F